MALRVFDKRLKDLIDERESNLTKALLEVALNCTIEDGRIKIDHGQITIDNLNLLFTFPTIAYIIIASISGDLEHEEKLSKIEKLLQEIYLARKNSLNLES